MELLTQLAIKARTNLLGPLFTLSLDLMASYKVSCYHSTGIQILKHPKASYINFLYIYNVPRTSVCLVAYLIDPDHVWMPVEIATKNDLLHALHPSLGGITTNSSIASADTLLQ
jgi:hypothetical protein